MPTTRAGRWFSPARFGMFYHWGICTGGGSTSSQGAPARPRYPTMAALAAAAPDPQRVAENLCALTRSVGAGYHTFTVLHSCAAYAVNYPTSVADFALRSGLDYVGALIAASRRHGLRLLLYLPGGGAEHAFTAGGPWIRGLSGSDDRAGYAALLLRLADDLRQRFGADLDGFWFDGTDALPPLAQWRERFPEALLVVNNETTFRIPEMDASTTEFLTGEPDPPYDRTSALVKPQIQWADHIQPPGLDRNEDIPACNDWWFRDRAEPSAGERPYLEDPLLWVRQLVACLGQRRSWNHAMGIGPLIDGSCPPRQRPMVAAMARFMAWAAPALVGTEGGGRSRLQPGFVNGGGWAGVTRSLEDPRIHYVLVTTAPNVLRRDLLILQHDGAEIAEAVDLRTGRALALRRHGAWEVQVDDWSDVADYGATIIRLVLREP